MDDIQKDIIEMKEQKMLDWTDEQYFNDTRFVTNSMLSKISQGGVQHLKSYLEGSYEPKRHNDVGHHFHTICLEPQHTDERYFVMDDRSILIELKSEYKNPKATKKYKEWRADQEARAEGKVIIECEDYQNNFAMRDRLMSYKPIEQLLTNSGNVFEKVYFNHFKKFGVDVKCKTDARNYGNYLFDLKSTKDPVTKYNMMKAITKYGYDRQAAYYLDVTGEDQFFFIFVEKTYPYTCGIVEMTKESIQEGRNKNEYLLEAYVNYFGKNAKMNPEDFFLMCSI